MPLAAQTVSPFNGIWKLNLAKSRYTPVSMTPNGTVAPWRGTINGQPNPDQNGISVTCVDARTLHMVGSLNGTPTTTQHNVVAADGKTRTVTTTGVVQGIKVSHRAFYEKQ